jgi:hypothetical protein
MAVNWHYISKIWCQIFGYAKMAPLAHRWHHWQVVGTIGKSLARFFFPDVFLFNIVKLC